MLDESLLTAFPSKSGEPAIYILSKIECLAQHFFLKKIIFWLKRQMYCKKKDDNGTSSLVKKLHPRMDKRNKTKKDASAALKPPRMLF
jgi:hypothetical protein